MPKAAQRQFLLTVDGLPGYWAVRTGGEPTTAHTKVWDGGATEAEVLTAHIEVGDLTISRPYDLVRDAALLPGLLASVRRWTTTISQMDTDADGIPTGATRQWIGVLVNVKAPDANTSSGTESTIQLLFACTRAS